MTVALAGEPHSLIQKNCSLDQQLNSGRPGKAEAAGEFEVPVTEDWKTKIGAKSALRQALPDCDQICNQIVMRSP